MKKTIIVCLIVFLTIFFLITLFDILWEKDFNKFDYDNAKENTIEYLNENEEQLIKIVDNLYKSKLSEQKPYKNISSATYSYLYDFNFKDKTEYIKFHIDSQGMLGGQYYGLIYSKNNNDDLIIYDEYKETGDGNNIFIRQKIKDNWYFYYEDFDGKVDIKKVK